MLASSTQQYDSFPNDLEEVEGLMHEYKIKAEMCRNMDTRVCKMTITYLYVYTLGFYLYSV